MVDGHYVGAKSLPRLCEKLVTMGLNVDGWSCPVWRGYSDGEPMGAVRYAADTDSWSLESGRGSARIQYTDGLVPVVNGATVPDRRGRRRI